MTVSFLSRTLWANLVTRFNSAGPIRRGGAARGAAAPKRPQRPKKTAEDLDKEMLVSKSYRCSCLSKILNHV